MSEKPSLRGEWNRGTVPIEVLESLNRHTRRTVSRLWHALYDGPLTPDEQRQLRRLVGDLQVVANLVQPQLPPCPTVCPEAGPDTVVTNQWREAGMLSGAVRTLSMAVQQLAIATEGLLAQGPVPKFGTPSIPASAYLKPIVAREQTATRLLRDIESAMNTITSVGRRIHEGGVQRLVLQVPPEPQHRLTFLGTKAAAHRAHRVEGPVGR